MTAHETLTEEIRQHLGTLVPGDLTEAELTALLAVLRPVRERLDRLPVNVIRFEGHRGARNQKRATHV
jgi:hypothetical protein